MNFGRERIEKILNILDHPQNKVPAIHITGTNGKGSVSALLTSIFTQSIKGQSIIVGTFNSPHLIHPSDMIKINGRPLSIRLYDEFMSLIENENQQHKIGLSIFEKQTAVAFYTFLKLKCSISIIEVGLGGLLDATNVITYPMATVLTSVSLDHVNIIGPSWKDIIHHKMGICRDSIPLFVSDQDEIHISKDEIISKDEVKRVITIEAKEKKCPVYFTQRSNLIMYATGFGKLFSSEFTKAEFNSSITNESFDYELGLEGEAQLINASLSIEIVLYFLRHARVLKGIDKEEFLAFLTRLDIQDIKKGLRETHWPGRLEWLHLDIHMTLDDSCIHSGWRCHNKVLLDGAHNPAGMYYLSKYVNHILDHHHDYDYMRPIHHISWVFGMTYGKDLGHCCEILFNDPKRTRLRQTIYLVQFPSSVDMTWIQSMTMDQLCTELIKYKSPTTEIFCKGKLIDLAGPCKTIDRDHHHGHPCSLLIVAGSLYLISHFYQVLNINPFDHA